MTATRTHIALGAFRLWHTFSSENLYTAQQGIVRWMVDDDESESANPFGFDFYDYFFSQIGNELSAMADAVTDTISSCFLIQKKIL